MFRSNLAAVIFFVGQLAHAQIMPFAFFKPPPTPVNCTGYSISRVQIKAPGYTQASTQTTSITLTAGNLLVVGVYYNTFSSTMSVTDNKGNTWHSLSAISNGQPSCNGGGSQAQIWYAENVAAGATNVTVTQSGGGTQPVGVFMGEYSGLKTSGSIDGSVTFSTTAQVSAMTTGSLTATGCKDLVFTVFNDTVQSGGSMTVGSGQTVIGTDTNFISMAEDNSGAGYATLNATVSPTGTDVATSQCWVGASAAFKTN